MFNCNENIPEIVLIIKIDDSIISKQHIYVYEIREGVCRILFTYLKGE